ncbi:autotransporter family protein [Bartonella sp. B17]
MTKVFKNHINLCAFTTAIFSLFQNGVAVCANIENSDADKRGKGSYVITVSSSDKLNVFLPNFNSFLDGRPIDGDVRFDDRDNSHGEEDSSKSYFGSSFVEMTNDKNGNRVDIHCDSNRGICARYQHNPKRNNAYQDIDRGLVATYYYYNYYNATSNEMFRKDQLHKYECNNCGEKSRIDEYFFKITSDDVDKVLSDHSAIWVRGKSIGGEVKKARVSGNKVKIISEVSEAPFAYAVYAFQDGEVDLTNLTVKNARIVFYANSNGKIKVNHGDIEGRNAAIKAINKGSVALYNVKMNTSGVGEKASISSSYDSEVWMNGQSFDFMDNNGVYSAENGKVSFENVTITGRGGEKNRGDYAVFLMDKGGNVEFKDGNINATDFHGIVLEDTISDPNAILVSREGGTATAIYIKNSFFTVDGDSSHGIYFKGSDKNFKRPSGEETLEEKVKVEAVDLRDTTLSVKGSAAAVYSANTTYGLVTLLQSAINSKDFLLKAEKGSSVQIFSQSSILKGRTFVDKDSVARLYFSGGSTWILPQNQRDNSHESNISSVDLSNSSIYFEKPKSAQDHFYQILRIGTGRSVVYKAEEGARISLNTYLASDGSHDNRQTDRVLIHGSVEGTTTVHVRAVSENSEKYEKIDEDSGGISLIQVSGEAEGNSFKLANDYVTLNGLPYAYRLYAQYGEESDLAENSFSKRLVEGEGKFWNFYLKSAYVKPKPDQPEFKPEAEKPDSDLGVKVVVPQVPTYLLLPNALFHSGLVDISNLSKRLEAMRISFEEPSKSDEGSAFFVRGYGGNYHYSSDLPVFKYGYGGDFDYNAVEAGVLFKAIESAYGTTSFGVIGTYGKLSLQPVDVEQSKKSAFEKWMLTAYGSMQHDGGAYVNGLVSYGLFQGDVFTRARGKTATLKGHPLSVSVIAGKALMVGSSGLVFDPQVQVVYQHLQFNHAHDIDNFAIKLGNLEQWVTRVGGRLTKTLSAKEDARVLSFYGKLHFAHGFGDNQTVHFKDAFQLGAFGSSLEAGLGFHAQLLPKLTLNGDLMYQHKLTKAGFSGATFSGGLRYQF